MPHGGALILVLAAGVYIVGSRYELQVVAHAGGRIGRESAWRLDRWTGEVCAVDRHARLACPER